MSGARSKIALYCGIPTASCGKSGDAYGVDNFGQLWTTATHAILLFVGILSCISICCKRQYYYDLSNRLQLKILDEKAVFKIGDTLNIDVEIINTLDDSIDIRIDDRAFSLMILDTSKLIYGNIWFIGTHEEKPLRVLRLKNNEKRNIRISMLGINSVLFPGEYDLTLFLNLCDRLDNQEVMYNVFSLNRINIKIID